MPYHRIINKCNRVRGWCWGWLNYTLHNFLLRNNMLHIFRNNNCCSWEFLKFHTCVGVSFLKKCRHAALFHVCFSLYPIIHVNYIIFILHRTLLWIFGKWLTSEKKHSFRNKDIYMCGSQTFWSCMKFYFAHIVKVCFVFKKQSLCLYSSAFA